MVGQHGMAHDIGGLIGDLIGWAFCMAMLSGAYFLGFILAQHFGGADHRDSFGILSAITLVWCYEHRLANDRWTKLLNPDRNSAEK